MINKAPVGALFINIYVFTVKIKIQIVGDFFSLQNHSFSIKVK